MGYRHQIARVKVKFEPSHEYHGCEVTLRKLNLGEWLAITGLGDEEIGVRHIGDQLRGMADRIIEWNLEDPDTGAPVPTTVEAVMRQDRDLMMAILNAWLDGMTAVPAPLEKSSPAGGPSPVESIPMDTLSSSLVS